MLVAQSVLTYLTTLLKTSSVFNTITPEENLSEEESGNKPIVELHICDGDFSSKGSAVLGKQEHSFTIEISVIASAAASYNLSVLENPDSTEAQKLAAIAAGQHAATRAYSSAFSTFVAVFGLINDRRNMDFGLTKYTVKGRDFGKYTMSRHVLNGNLATVFCTSELKCIVEEVVTGATPEASEDPPITGVTDAIPPD